MSEQINRGLRWLVLVTMFVVTATTSAFMIAPAPVIGEISSAIPQHSTGQITFITMSIFSIFLIVAAILGGSLLDKFGVMKAYIGGLIIISTGALLAPFIGSSFKGMTFIRILQGLGAGPIMVSVIPLAARYFPPRQRSIIMVFQGLAVLSGIEFGLFFILWIFHITNSWQISLAWLAPISIPGLIFSFIVILTSKEPEGSISMMKTPFIKDINTALQNPATYVVLICASMFTWINQAFNYLIPPYLNYAPPSD